MKRFYLYIDDSGTRFPDRKPQVARADGIDCFALGGILIEDRDRPALQAAHDVFCQRWNVTTPLHSTKIRGRRDDFVWLGEDVQTEQSFLNDLQSMMLGLPVLGFAAVINRPGYNKRYQERYGDQRWWMCKTAYTILIERVCKYVQAQRGTLTIRFEETGKKEDRAIIGYAKDMKRTGAPFDNASSGSYGALGPDDYKRIIEGEPRRVTKKDSPAVQIADLYLYPMMKAGYNPTYAPWLAMCAAKKVIDALLSPEDRAVLGIKFSCFDKV
jgi:hypothetical protein